MPTPPSPTAIAVAVRRQMAGEFARDSCIAAARITIEVCDYFGIKARPLPVRVAAYTAMAWELRDVLVDKPVDEWPAAAYSTGIAGGESAPGRWNGHLVALAGLDEPAAPAWLIDASLGQLSRPSRNLPTGPAAFTLWNGLPAGPDETLVLTTKPHGVVICYGLLDDDGWRESPNWSRRRGYILRT